MQICSKCHTHSPDSATHCSNCQAELSQFSEAAVTLQRIQDNPRIAYVRIAVSRDCCPACREAQGAYAKETAPKLPIEGCSHGMGCRCFYQPVFEEIYP